MKQSEYHKDDDFEWVTRMDIARALSNSKELCTDLKLLTKELSTYDLSSVGTNMNELFALLMRDNAGDSNV